MNAYKTLAFVDELEKLALAPSLVQRALRSGVGRAVVSNVPKVWGSGFGRAAAGALPGAAIGAVADPQDSVRGAVLGGLAGAGAGYASPLLTAGGRARAREALKQWGREQKHSFVGGELPIKKSMKPEEIAKLRSAEKAGLTSLPGVVKGMAKRPLQTMKAGWQHAGGLGKAMIVGDVALQAPGLVDPTTPEGTGEKALRMLGGTAGFLAGGKLPMLASLAPMAGLAYLGGKAGRGIDVLTGERAKKKKMMTAAQQAEADKFLRVRPTTALAQREARKLVPAGYIPAGYGPGVV